MHSFQKLSNNSAASSQFRACCLPKSIVILQRKTTSMPNSRRACNGIRIRSKFN